jgi:hypothetical protein
VRTTFVSANSLEFTAPKKAQPCFCDITVTNPDKESCTVDSGLQYVGLDAPAIENITPVKGPATGGTRVTIHGKSFVVGCRIHFGGKPVTLAKIKDPQTLEVTVPANAPGMVDVVVTNVDEQAVTLTRGFMYEAVPDPVLENLAPKYGPSAGGTRLTLFGKHFVSGMKVHFGSGSDAVVVDKLKLVDAGTIEVTMPAGPKGLVDITVSSPTGQSATMKRAFQYS